MIPVGTRVRVVGNCASRGRFGTVSEWMGSDYAVLLDGNGVAIFSGGEIEQASPAAGPGNRDPGHDD